MDLLHLAEKQYGTFSRRQAIDLGITDRQIERQLDRWQIERFLPGVFRVRGLPTSWHQKLMGATLSCPVALASHRAATALCDVRGFGEAPVEICVERWSRSRLRDFGVVVHETKDLVAADIDERHGIPCTSLVRTMVDLPAVVHEVRAGDALDQVSRRDAAILKRIHARHLEVARRGRNGTVKLRALLEERGLGDHKVDSGFERKALRVIENAGLARPVTQHQVRSGEFVCYLDIAWPDQLLAMECDSLEHHLSERAFRWERKRRRMLAGLGWTVLEFTYREVHDEPLLVVRDLRRHLHQDTKWRT